jgi:tRNA pseudouridine55 synthase
MARSTKLPNYPTTNYKIAMNCVLIIDKPGGMTSHDVVNRVRRILKERSVGHLGTLDPSATGVLPLVIGALTRLAQFYTASEKAYEGVIRFGFATDTYDADGEPVGVPRTVAPTFDAVYELAAGFRGFVEQLPPPFSAKKIQGVPAYKLARKKEEVVLNPVRVEIKEFEILAVDGDCASFQARVASGTYLRSVAHDMGQRMGCGAHLRSLRRTAVAEFELADAHLLEELTAAAEKGTLADLFVHPRKLLPRFPAVTANEDMAAHIRSGRTVNLPEFSKAQQVKVFSGQRELIAIATRVAGTLFHPRIVLLGSDTAHAVR